MTFRTPLTRFPAVIATVALVASLGFASFLIGCKDQAGTPNAKPIKLAFVTNNASEFWKIAAAGVRKYEGEGKVQVDVKMPTNGTT